MAEICPERKRLMSELGDALKRMLSIQNKELEAVIRGDLNANFDDELERAAELRDHYKRLLAEHVASHGC